MASKKSPNKAFWLCYVVMIIISIAVYFLTHFRRFITYDGAFDYMFGYGSLLFVILIVSFVIALILGVKNSYMKWLYPFFSALFIWFVPPFYFCFLIIIE